MRINAGCCLLFAVFLSCNMGNDAPDRVITIKDSLAANNSGTKDLPYLKGDDSIKTGTTTSAEVLSFAKTLNGIPYKYGSINSKEGFDCSGFITYVFNHFGIAVPRTSADFTNVRHEVQLKDAKPGDLILFTGTDSLSRVVGHMGIITANAGKAEDITFIHSTSGKANGVTETPFNVYYQGRYVKTIRIFPQNDQ